MVLQMLFTNFTLTARSLVTDMTKGIILKGIGGFYYVETAERIIECRARGVFRKKDVKPLPGDYVEIDELQDGTGSVVNILPRKNSFIRPPIANLDCIVIVAAAKNPNPDLKFIDKMLLISESKGVSPIICFNKCDLTADYERYADIYRKIGYKVIETSTVENSGIDKLKESIFGKTIAFAGFSGVGKSSLMNKIFHELNLETGDISRKLNRGRHTTRHVELFKFDDNSYIADTPGFSMLEIYDVDESDLENYFIEFSRFSPDCKFSGCAHLAGKHCGVINAVDNGEIAPERYENYLDFYQTIKNNKEKY